MPQPFTDSTISGVPVNAFAARPTPRELAWIVAAMDSEDQASFLIELGERLRFICSVENYGIQLAYIRQAVRAQEAANHSGYGSDLLRELNPDLETA